MNHTTSFGMPLSLKASTQVKYNVSNWFDSIKKDPTLEGSNETVIIFCFLLRLVDRFFFKLLCTFEVKSRKSDEKSG